MDLLDIINSDLDMRMHHSNKTHNISKLKRILLFIKLLIIRTGIRPVFFYRVCRYFYIKDMKFFFNIFQFLNLILNDIQISVTTKIGTNLSIPHPQCIVIGGGEIGNNAFIFQGVTLGYRGKGYPTIGNNVTIGAGAKVLGEVHIGDYAVVAANAVVLNDVPPCHLAAGIPAVNKKLNYQSIRF